MSYRRELAAIQAARLAIDTVDSNHVNDLAEEVVANALTSIIFEQTYEEEDDEDDKSE